MGNVNKNTGRFAPSTGKGPKTKTPPPVSKQQKPSKSFMKKETQRPKKVRATLGAQQDANTKTTLGG
tara:strand:- start:245 stop:445 length:201 start_codon:yes stop_codon:yes gene_type:complete